MYPSCDLCQTECFIDLTDEKLLEGFCFRCIQILRVLAEKFKSKDFEMLRDAVLNGAIEQETYLKIMNEIFAPN